MPKRTKDTITLGSGQFHMIEHTDSIPANITDLITALFADANRIARTKGGASLEYTQETYEEKDDLGYVLKIITTDEAAKIKGGLLTWNGETISMLVDRSTVNDNGGRGPYRVTRIGGKGNEKGKYYVIGFKHDDVKDGNVYVIIVGRNTAGLNISFTKEAGSVIEPEFSAIPCDDEGTLVMFVEEIGSSSDPQTNATTGTGKRAVADA